MTKPALTSSTHKVRRDATGGKRGMGHEYQAKGRKVVRPDATRTEVVGDDPSLTALGGLVGFGSFLRAEGVDSELQRDFGAMKVGKRVVYTMGGQLRMLIDAAVAGQERVFGLEGLAADPLFVRLNGGTVPSIDTVYRDLERFKEDTVVRLESYMAGQGLAALRTLEQRVIHLDIDTTVEPLFGEQEGAEVGYNPRYHGRVSYHPILGHVAETRTVVGAKLRPGDTGLGADDAATMGAWVTRVREAAPEGTVVYMRADAGADCAEIFDEVRKADGLYLVKARLTPDLCAAIAEHTQWDTVEYDAEGRIATQVAVVPFSRQTWRDRNLFPRVVVVRTRERENGKQTLLWPDLEYGVQAYITNDNVECPMSVALRYNGRAEIEPAIAEWKGAWGIGKVPSQVFDANHAMLLVKLLAHNLFRRFVDAVAVEVRTWRTSWLRRALVWLPGRLTHSARQWKLHISPTSLVARLAPQPS
jgi:hypothetical protein